MQVVIKKITNYMIAEKIIQDNKKEIFEYGLLITIELILNIIGIIIIAVLFDCIYEIVLFSIGLNSIRIYAGGYHAKRASTCFILSALVNLISFNIARRYPLVDLVFVIMLTIASVIIGWYAPVDCENKRLSHDLKNKCKIRSILVVLVYSFLLLYFKYVIKIDQYWCDILLYALLAESISMLPIFNKR